MKNYFNYIFHWRGLVLVVILKIEEMCQSQKLLKSCLYMYHHYRNMQQLLVRRKLK